MGALDSVSRLPAGGDESRDQSLARPLAAAGVFVVFLMLPWAITAYTIAWIVIHLIKLPTVAADLLYAVAVALAVLSTISSLLKIYRTAEQR